MSWRSPFDPELASFDFASLRQAGIEAAQRLSGDLWTDYNLHDPGVTIFEQLIYALTELDYLMTFPVADLLTGPDGAIDFDCLVLRPPDEIFPCRPTTSEDYRLTLLDAFPALDDVQVRADADASGLFHVDLRSDDVITDDDEAALIKDVATVYHQQRNLGEDLAGPPCFVRPHLARLSGCIDIDPAFDPTLVLADVYLEIRALLIAAAEFAPFESIRQQGLALEGVFSGPIGQSGISSSRLNRFSNSLPDPERLRETIKTVAGVRAVDAIGLDLVDPARSSSPAWRLHLPQQPGDIAVELFADGVRFEIDSETLKRVFSRRLARSRADGEQLSSKDAFALPRGRHLPMDDYVSVQEQFPRAYGLGRYPQDISTDPAERARINQLRGYLIHFDQLLSDLQSNIAHIRDLFSADIQTGQSYRSNPLNPGATADLSAVYPDQPDQVLAGIRAEFDDFVERKGRILDYLLALYGETPRPLPGRGSVDARQWLDTRLEMLRRIRTFGRDRAGGMNLRTPIPAPGGYHDRLAALLGDKKRGNAQIVCGDEDALPDFFVVEHVLLRPHAGSSREQSAFYRNRLSIVFAADQGRNSEQVWRGFVEETVTENTPAHLFVDVLWLDGGHIVAFKLLYDRWRDALPGYCDDPSLAEPAAEMLAEFLMSMSATTVLDG